MLNVYNSTDDDAKVKVSGGSGGYQSGRPGKNQVVELHLGPGESKDLAELHQLSKLPALPWTVEFSIEVNHSCKVKSSAVKRLTFKKAPANGGYQILRSR